MIIYNETKDVFLENLDSGILDEKLYNLVKDRFGRETPISEVRAWNNSLVQIGMRILRSGIPDDCGIAIEYNIPYTSKRVDLIVSGYDDKGRNNAVIVELKQWESAERVSGKDGIVRTFLGGTEREVAHPSYQAWSYAMAINDFNADVQDIGISLHPCAYLHNYALVENDPIIDIIYEKYLKAAPVFTKRDGKNIEDFLKKFIKKGDDKRTIFYLDSGRLRPSKSLQDVLASMMRGNSEFTLLDTQKVIYEEILAAARQVVKSGKKHTIIVKGGPGTGKSVLAINLLTELINRGMSASYVSKNAAPRNVYNQKLKGDMKKSRIDILFSGSGAFTDLSSRNRFDVLLADEAHRLNEKSGLFGNLGENQIMEIIRASKLSVFFIDEDQIVTMKDIGSISEIRKHAEALGSTVYETELDSQFRCSGSDGYISWLDNMLDIRETANPLWDDSYEYDFRLFDNPNELRDAIFEKNRPDNKSRLVAGYCWNWIKEGKNDSSIHDIVLGDYNFEMSWNLGSSQTWAIDPDSVREIGCIHTCQGLEFDYVGVIIGPDLRYENGHIVTDVSKRAKTDQSVKGIKSLPLMERERKAATIIKNTYKVLMSRGMKGCYVYCCDKGLQGHIGSLLKNSSRS
ncbi:MAG: DUF2075 domain-containing protein [Thermoplasmata archaeon]|nr:DUF2075 domain-containing protein [Thermoplasmata archaeon]